MPSKEEPVKQNWNNIKHAQLGKTSNGSREVISTMPCNGKLMKHKVEQYKEYPVIENLYGESININDYQSGRTSVAWDETLQAMPSNDEPVKNELKQY